MPTFCLLHGCVRTYPCVHCRVIGGGINVCVPTFFSIDRVRDAAVVPVLLHEHSSEECRVQSDLLFGECLGASGGQFAGQHVLPLWRDVCSAPSFLLFFR